jgi:spore germination cell wall hydrolase CwlJ-like protein
MKHIHLTLAALLFAAPAYGQTLYTATTDAECLAAALYHEARGEDATGIGLVASVIMNRVDHPAYPDTICAVVKQEGQFTFDHHLSYGHNFGRLAELILSGEWVLPITDALYFSGIGQPLPPYCRKMRVFTHGGHLFCAFISDKG